MSLMIGLMTLKTQLRAFLKTKGMTAADLSRASNVPKQSISDWLAGTPPRNLDHLKRVANVFRVSIDELLFGDKPKTESESEKVADLDSILGDQWVSGVFEVRFRRLRK
jgi:transcriptional regulator with XRE-family HTH domain